jgi:hypothetical protein
VRASAVSEKAGVPSVTEICSPFVEQAKIIANMMGVPGAPIAEYPGHISVHSPEQRRKNVEEVVLPQIIAALTQPIEEEQSDASEEPGPRDIVFEGTFDEINALFYEKQWSDGLPVVPPTIGRVEEFLKYADRSPDEVLGVLLPGNRSATVWSVAVNGVMAGCHPEHMPVLISMVEVMADPRFSLKDAGASPGWEAMVILNGPIIKQLNFNFQAGVLRPGSLANTSTGRFWRLYLRNVAQSLPGTTDKSTWGRNFHVVLAENHDALQEMGWEPLSVQQGFDSGDNVITVQSTRGRSYDSLVEGSTAKENLDMIAYALRVFQQQRLCQIGGEQSVLLGLTPLNAAVIARGGFSKKDVMQYLWENARLPAKVIEDTSEDGKPWNTTSGKGETLCEAVRMGILPESFCMSDDPNRMVPLWRSPDELRIVVSGDPGRNRALTTGSNLRHGLATSKRILLPANWQKLISRK